MQNHYTMFAAYNSWANDRLFQSATALTAEEYKRDVGAFFHSMNGTLNHVLVADRIWMHRFTGEGERPAALDTILYDTLDSLHVARKAEDRRISRYIDRLEAHDLVHMLRYTPTTPSKPMALHLSSALSHFFNHQTHHRGQAHTILSILGKEPPPLDILYFLREDAGKRYA